jgi:hypothetical protein
MELSGKVDEDATRLAQGGSLAGPKGIVECDVIRGLVVRGAG